MVAGEWGGDGFVVRQKCSRRRPNSSREHSARLFNSKITASDAIDLTLASSEILWSNNTTTTEWKPPMKFRFFCPVCKAAYLATARDVGKKSDCKNCGQRIEVPPPLSRTQAVLGEVEPSSSEPFIAKDEGRSRQTEPQSNQDTPRSKKPVAKFAHEPPPLPRRKSPRKKASFLGIIVCGSLMAVGALAVVSGVVFALHEKWHLENQVKNDIERRGIAIEDVTLHKSGTGYRGFARTYAGYSFAVTVVLDKDGRWVNNYSGAPQKPVTVDIPHPVTKGSYKEHLDAVRSDPSLGK